MYEPIDEIFLLEYNTHKKISKLSWLRLKILKILNIEKFKTSKELSAEPDYVKIFNFL